MLGLKLFSDTSPTHASEIINRAVRDRLGLEVLLVGTNGVRPPAAKLTALLDETDFSRIPNKILHLDPRKSEGWKIADPSTRAHILSELHDMLHLGIDRAVMHYHHELPITQSDNVAMAKNLVPLNDVAESHGVVFYLENTLFKRDPADPEFYRRMFEQVATRNLSNLGFCFDMGNAKAHSKKRLHDWISLLDWMRDLKIPLHLHLHNNNGSANRHLPFMEAERQGLNEGDWFTGGIHYLVAVSELLARYPGVKILESPASSALVGLDWLQGQLSRKNPVSV